MWRTENDNASLFYPSFFPFSSFHSFLLARMEFYFLWNATDLRMSLFFGMLIRFTINNLVKSRQYFARMSIWNSLRWFAMSAFFPCNWTTTAFFSFQIFDTGFDMMSLAIKPHEILSLLMTDLITFCLYGIRNLVMGNLQADRVLWKTFNRSKNHNCYCSLLLLVCHFESNWEFYSSTSKNYKWWRRSLAMYHFESW